MSTLPTRTLRLVTTREDLGPRYAEIEALTHRALAALAAARCPCCNPWARAEGLRLSSLVVQKTSSLDRRLRALGALTPDGAC